MHARLGSLVGGVEGRASGPRARAMVRRAARSAGPIVAGPWLSEVGFEVLYWRPFLTWVIEHHGIDPGRVTVVTRGGAGAWYEGIAGRTADAFTRCEPAGLQELQAERLGTRHRSQKQLAPTAGERALLTGILGDLGLRPDEVALLHPAAMYLRFKGFWDGWRTESDVGEATVNRPIQGIARGASWLPDRYVAAKVYFSDCYPDTPRNREFAVDTLRSLAGEDPLVLLSTGISVDDHDELSGSAGGWLGLPPDLAPAENLRVQSEVIAGASAFVGTYGGFSYLAPFLGVPSLSFYSERNFIQQHLQVMGRALEDLRREAPRAEFVAVHRDQLDLPGRLASLAGGGPR